jgi:hypothetical protein
LPWRKIDWGKRRLTVISRDQSASEGGFTVKDKDAKAVPIGPELYELLLASKHEDGLVIPPGGVVYSNHWRDFEVVRERAGVAKYAKPIHCLRKSCLTDWAGRFPAHVVKEWAGHSDVRTTVKYYLKVSVRVRQGSGHGSGQGRAKAGRCRLRTCCGFRGEDRRTWGETPRGQSVRRRGEQHGGGMEGSEPSILPISADLTQNQAQNAGSEPSSRRKSKAGDGIRTHDVQLGNTNPSDRNPSNNKD